jgi:membrane protease YdiL (CAAX protease family)
MVIRIRQGTTVVPCQPRHPVPWRGIDVLVVFLVYLAAPSGAMLLSMGWFDLGDVQTPAVSQAAPLRAEHPAARVLEESGDPWALALCIAAVVLVAALIEEFLFRLVLQGWLENVENRSLRRLPQFRGMVRGTVAVAVSSILFAMVHYRPSQPPVNLRLITFSLAVQAIASLLTLGFAVSLLRFRTGATLRDLGVVPEKLAADVKLGLLAFLAVTPPVLLVHIAVRTLLPQNLVADPIPIFFLALALGVLYFRTHRIVPAIVLHMAFNATGVVMALTISGK